MALLTARPAVLVRCAGASHHRQKPVRQAAQPSDRAATMSRDGGLSAAVKVLLLSCLRSGRRARTGPLAEILRTLPRESWCRFLARSARPVSRAASGASSRCLPGWSTRFRATQAVPFISGWSVLALASGANVVPEELFVTGQVAEIVVV